MKQLIKYAALIFALILSASIIGGCLTAGVAIVKMIAEKNYDGENRENNDIWYRNEEGEVVFFGINFSGSDEVKSGSETFNASEVDAMYLEVLSGELLVETWEEDYISVVYENISKNYEIQNNKGTLTITREENHFFWNGAFREKTKITVNVPANKVFGEVKIDKGSGSAKVTGISANTFLMDTGSGGTTIANIMAEKTVFDSGSGSFSVKNSELGESSMDAGSGFVNFENVVAENLVVESGSGRVDVIGYLTGNCVFDTGSGSVNIEIYGEEENYNIRAELGSGSFYVNGEKTKDTRIEHKNASNLLIFDAGSGRVSVEFKEAPADFRTNKDAE